MLAALLFVIALNLIAVFGFSFARPVGLAAAATLVPGAWAIWSWAPLHYGSSFAMVLLVNVAFYYFLFLAALGLKRRLARRSAA